MMLSDVCLSVAYIWPKSRTERPRKTKIGIEVAHITRDSGTTFKVKRSKINVIRPLYSLPCWRVRRLQRWAWERVGRGKLLLHCRQLGGARLFGAHGGRKGAGAYRGGRRLHVVKTALSVTCHIRLLSAARAGNRQVDSSLVLRCENEFLPGSFTVSNDKCQQYC